MSPAPSARTDDLLPVIIPTEIVTHHLWPGVHKQWNDMLSVTWAHLREPNTTTYLTKSEAEDLTANAVPFAQLAWNNLRRRSSGEVWTHAKEEAGEIHFVVMLHVDGLGPSRLLLRDELRQVFPGGFRFCVPERTCAIVFSKQASPAALDSVQTIVRGCFEGGREAVSQSVFTEADIAI